MKGQEFLVDLNDHNSVVNCVRFSPCGKMLATSSDRQIIIYQGENSATTIYSGTFLIETVLNDVIDANDDTLICCPSFLLSHSI